MAVTMSAAIAENPVGPRPSGKLRDPLAIAVLAAAISAAWSGRPSLWWDEAATISAATDRSLPQLWRLLEHVDAVHGLYYLLMHGWFAVFPPTEFWSRLPSALAVGAGAAGVLVCTRLFAGRAPAVCAGIVFAILPRITWAGCDARPYALAAAAAVWLTVMLVVAIRRGSWCLWLCYALALMLSILLSINITLLVLSHAAMLPVLARTKSAVIWWTMTSATALGVMTPFILFAHGQVWQIGWVAQQKRNLFLEVVSQQYFGGDDHATAPSIPTDHSVAFAILAGIVIATALAARVRGHPGPGGDTRRLVIVCAAWILIPTGVELAYSAFIKPIYQPRYLILTAPAMAVVLAICIVMIARKPWPSAGVLTLFAIAAFPNYLFTQRSQYPGQGWDNAAVADLISAHAAPGDCLLLDGDAWQRSLLVRTRPAAFQSLVDVERQARAADLGTLADGRVAVWLRTARIDQCTAVWTIANRDQTRPVRESGPALPAGSVLGPSPTYQLPAKLGFRIVERWQFVFAQVVKSTR